MKHTITNAKVNLHTGDYLSFLDYIIYNDIIWLLGCNRNGESSSQVLVSEDGKNWSGSNTPWSPRGGIATTVHKGNIYMTGGKYGGTPSMPDFRYSNDVWVMGK